jgi:amino acid transporter
MSGTAADPNSSVPVPAPASARLAADPAESILQRAGYQPELRRSLRFFSMFAIAFSIISITTGIFLNYGFGLAYWGPASIWTWPIVGVGNLMIALVPASRWPATPTSGALGS